MNNELDWKHLPFGYYPTDFNVRCTYKDGKWGEIEVTPSDKIELHMAATCLHYGQECFEGLKAFRGVDGKIRIFRMHDNAERMRQSAEGIEMQPVHEEIFNEMCIKAVKLNERFVPPYGSGASLYIRPLEIGVSPSIGVKSATEYVFMVMVTPVGPYFKTGFGCTDICIMRQYDRVAPRGTGRYKIGGNYAASLTATEHAHALGYSAVLFLDPKEKKYLDECGPANFFAIIDGKYVTPKSDSILPSITNRALQTLAQEMGIEVVARQITVDELEKATEAGACGTAAVISPVGTIRDLDNERDYVISADRKPGPICTALYEKLNAIRLGEEPDTHNWNTIVE